MILIARSPFSFAANRVVRPLQLLRWWFACLLLLGMVQTSAFAVTPMVVAGGSHSCALSSAGAVTCWGLNDAGQLGNGSITNSLIPVAVTGLSSGVTAITAGVLHTCALVNGAAKCWGYNNYGQLGDNSTTNSSVPVAVSGLSSGVTAITAGYYQTCAIFNGAAKCWGYNGNGELGNNSTTDSLFPVAVTGLSSGVTAITIGGAGQTCAIFNGAAKCWGYNGEGELGNGSTTNSLIPVAVTGLSSGVTAITAGYYHTCAIVNDAAQCWGWNGEGELGNGSTTNSLIPVAVTGLTNSVMVIAAGLQHTCTIDSSGATQCWGWNYNGQLGDGSIIDSPIPVAVTGLSSGVTAITAGSAHTCAIFNSAAKCWGFNGNGELGNNSTTDSLFPVAVMSTKSPQTISFGTAPSLTYGGAAGTISATATSNLAVTYTSTTTSICTVIGNAVTPLTIGTCTIAANQEGDANYNAAPQVTQNITVAKADQTINFGTAPTITYGSGTGLVSATATSGLSVTYTSTTPSVCTVSGSTVTPVTAGLCTIAANQAGDANYNAASEVTQSFTIAQATQTALIPAVTNVNPAYLATTTLSTTGGSSTGAVTYANNNGNCMISGTTLTAVAVGSCVVTATRAADTNYTVKTGTISITVTKANQTISFGTAPSLSYGSGTGLVSATATSGLSVTYTSTTPSVCTVIGSTVTPVTAGICTIAANQTGDSSYLLATQVTQNITIGKAAQATFTASVNNENLTIGNTVTLGATGGSGMGVITYASNNANCTISSITLTAAAVGSCTVTATKATDSNYLLATATVDITINAPAAPTAPVTPTLSKDGSASNIGDAGQELLIIGETAIRAGSSGGTIQATGVAGVSTVSVTSGSIVIPCPVAIAFCTSGQSTFTVLAGETVRFSADGKVSSIQINPATPSSSPARSNGQTLIDLIVATIQAKVPALGTEIAGKADAWNALGLGFTMGKLSVAAQLPMQVNPALADSVSLLPNGTLQVVTNGVIVNLVPALLDTDRFNATLKSFNPNAEMRINSDGTINVSSNRLIYSLRPHLFSVNGDQSIFPATYKFDQFSAMLLNLDSSATVQMQLDGKLALTIQGTTYILTPDYEVAFGTAPSGVAIHNGKLIVTYLFGFTQGFSIH